MTVSAVELQAEPPRLVRSLTLTHAVLYGLGVTIGAGIYVLVGIAAGRSGMHAPLAFVGAALAMAFSAASFAELGTRMPVSASEAAYVQAAFGREWLACDAGDQKKERYRWIAHPSGRLDPRAFDGLDFVRR
jgi:amino acid transporter